MILSLLSLGLLPFVQSLPQNTLAPTPTASSLSSIVPSSIVSSISTLSNSSPSSPQPSSSSPPPSPTSSTSTATALWQTVPCSQSPISDAGASALDRWTAADTNTSWVAALAAWSNYSPSALDTQLTFPEFISNFYEGPEQWNCQDIGNVACSVTVQCDETDVPAGFLILNSFSRVHQIHQNYHNALNDAWLAMQSQIGVFTDTFAPQLKKQSQSGLIKALLDVMTVVIGVASGFTWNVVIREAQIFLNDNYRSFAKDAVNSAISASIAIGKDTMPSSSTVITAQNDISSALGTLMSAWQASEATVLNQLFSGANSTVINQLSSLLQGGMMDTVPIDVDLTSTSAMAQKIMYGQLMPIAWAHAPAGFIPFILKTGDVCSSTVPDTVSYFMTADTHTKSGVCWNNNQFYVLTVETYMVVVDPETAAITDNPPFGQLAGGTNDVLDGTAWGGVTLLDMVISSYSGYLANGNQNGYSMSTDPSSSASAEELLFAGGIQTAGFFNFPVCTSLFNTIVNIADSSLSLDPEYPCGTFVNWTYPRA
ncbi:hypothetical protein BP6252_07411 [Coleophoma cylindrospora]|uniref:Uncharacterized protein n=1 Tax=Coleophoma cylindrospora TaxID=1849047 RepID=A0A3D8RHY7_9HELO|nr:hypothetical protein BP6252_07411 [Coleophoma cylindrospora]